MRAFGNNIVEREGEVRSHGHADLFLGFEIGKGGGAKFAKTSHPERDKSATTWNLEDDNSNNKSKRQSTVTTKAERVVFLPCSPARWTVLVVVVTLSAETSVLLSL